MSELDRQLLELVGKSNPTRRNQLLVDTYDSDRARRPERMRKLVRAGANINATDGFDGSGVVLILAQMGDLAALNAAVELGADPHARNDARQTALHVIADSRNLDVLCRLLDLRLDPNARSDGEETPLHDWAYRGSPGGVHELLDRGAQPNARRDDGMTPLHLAAVAGSADTVRTLLEGDADPSVVNDAGATALDVAKEHDRWEVAKVLNDRMSGGGGGGAKPQDPRVELETLARKLGAEAGERAIESGDWHGYAQDDLDPTDLATDYWESNYAYAIEDAYDALNAEHDLPPRRKTLDELFAAYYQAFVAATPAY